MRAKTPTTRPQASLKGTVVRGFVRYLDKTGRLHSVMANVPPETHQLMVNPPVATTWVSGKHSIAIIDAVGAETDAATVREMTRAAVGTLIELLQAPLRGILRLFGASPHAMYERASLIMGTSWRGYEYRYEHLAERAGRIELRSSGVRESLMSGESWAAGFEQLLDICSAKGEVKVETVVMVGSDSVVTLLVAWR